MELTPRAGRERLATVMDWIFGRLDDPRVERELAEAESHDPLLRADIEWARRLHRTARDLPLTTPPELLRQRLRQQFRKWNAAQYASESPPLELPASLVFDSRRDRLAAGVRGGDQDRLVHMAWRTDVAELIIQAREQDSGLVRLDGQILLGNPAARVFSVRAQSPGNADVVVDCDSLGRFQAHVSPDVDQLRVSNGIIAISAPVSLESL